MSNLAAVSCPSKKEEAGTKFVAGRTSISDGLRYRRFPVTSWTIKPTYRTIASFIDPFLDGCDNRLASTFHASSNAIVTVMPSVRNRIECLREIKAIRMNIQVSANIIEGAAMGVHVRAASEAHVGVGSHRWKYLERELKCESRTMVV